MDITKKIYWLLQSGITCFCGEKPTIIKPANPQSKADQPASVQAQTYAIQATTLAQLNTEKENFSAATLKKTAAHTLCGFGSMKPKLMCVFDMPDNDSDRSGIPLSGPSGETFKKMMQAIHLDLETQVYVTYFSPWRTPGNRPLTTAEQAQFAPFLKREIEFVKPEKILFFGFSMAKPLLGCDSLAKARGVWHDLDGIPTRVTLALSAVNNSTTNRQHTWADLQAVVK